METTLVFLKPDAVRRGLVGEVIGRFERKGFLILGLKMMELDEDFVRRHYAAHEGKEFYEPLVRFVTSSPVVACVLEGVGAVELTRSLLGATFGPEAAPGTIRGDFGASRRYNLAHGSDSLESARREIDLLFRPEELMEYELAASQWVFAKHLDKLI